jgi:small basic protein
MEALRNLGWTSLTILGACVGFFIGLVLAPELSSEMRWVLAIAVVAIFFVSLAIKRGRRTR